MQLHLDIGVDDLAEGEARALALGAVLASYQPQDDVRVLLDPAGHPFCLFQTGLRQIGARTLTLTADGGIL